MGDVYHSASNSQSNVGDMCHKPYASHRDAHHGAHRVADVRGERYSGGRVGQRRLNNRKTRSRCRLHCRILLLCKLQQRLLRLGWESQNVQHLHVARVWPQQQSPEIAGKLRASPGGNDGLIDQHLAQGFFWRENGA